MQSWHPDADYVLFTFHGPVAGFKVAFPRNCRLRKLFSKIRDGLTVDRQNTFIDILAKCLVDALAEDKAASGITRENVIQQLNEEYEVDDVKEQLESLEEELAAQGDETWYSGMMVIEEAKVDVKGSAACQQVTVSCNSKKAMEVQ